MSETYYINGIPPPKVKIPEKGLPQRREINSWADRPTTNIQVSLFIRALRKFYDVPYEETKSYFQIAGIHGYPGNRSWNGAPLPKYESRNTLHPKDPRFIYCTHNLMTFPTWHRVYLLLFEQRIYECMLDVIKELEFPQEDERSCWEAEAKEWRLPYWNWGLPSAGIGIPDLFKIPEIKIRQPKLKKAEGPDSIIVPNPLYRYQLVVKNKLTKMGDLPGEFKVVDVQQNERAIILPWSKCAGTSRWSIQQTAPEDWWAGLNYWPNTNEAMQVHKYYDWMEPKKQSPALKKIRQLGISDLMYRLLVPGNMKSFYAFATTQLRVGKPSEHVNDFLSLEYVHNNLHGFIGGGDLKTGVGHMQNVPAAAFDPIFWMHHCNIDLYFAVWQTLNPEKWWEEGNTPKSDEHLSPFYKKGEDGEKQQWTSDMVRDWREMNYDYDVLARDLNESNEKYLERIRQYVDSYPNTGSRALAAAQLEKEPAGFSKMEKDTYVDCVLNIEYDRSALSGHPYTLHFFLGKVLDDDIADSGDLIYSHPNHVGSVFTFTAQMDDVELTICQNCTVQSESGIMSTAQVPITLPLLNLTLHNIGDNASGDALRSLDSEAVKGYLKANLQIKAVDGAGDLLSRTQLPRTKVTAFYGDAEHFEDQGKTSVFKAYDELEEATTSIWD